MKNKSNKNQNIETAVVEVMETPIQTVESVVVNVEANTVKMLGRPVNPNSARQQRIIELETKRANGELKRGRPVVSGSKRQEVLAAREAKQANGIELRRGRPVNPNSVRQVMLAMKAVKAA